MRAGYWKRIHYGYLGEVRLFSCGQQRNVGRLLRKQRDQDLQLGNGRAVELAEGLGKAAVLGSHEIDLLHSLRKAVLLQLLR